MGILDRVSQHLLDKQRQELDELYSSEREELKNERLELLRRLEKSKEYRLALRDYSEGLAVREDALNQREADLKKSETKLKKSQAKLKADEKALRENISKEVMRDLEASKIDFERQKSQWLEYEKGLRRSEFTMLDWFKRVDRKEREIFDEILADVNRYKQYTEQIPQMDGFQFEQYVAGLLMRNGYQNVIVTQKSHDYGADITAERQEVKYVIQCKYYTSQVGIEAVQQIYAAKIHYNANVAVVATNSLYTRAAETLAKDLGVILWDGQEIHDMFESN